MNQNPTTPPVAPDQPQGIYSAPTPSEVPPTTQPEQAPLPPADSPKNNRKRLIIIAASIFILIAGLVGGYFLIRTQADAAAEQYKKDTVGQLADAGKATSYQKQVEIFEHPAKLRFIPLGALVSTAYKTAESTLVPQYTEVAKAALKYSQSMNEYTRYEREVLTPFTDIYNDPLQASSDKIAAQPSTRPEVLVKRAEIASKLQKIAASIKSIEVLKEDKDAARMAELLEESAFYQRIWVELYAATTKDMPKEHADAIKKYLADVPSKADINQYLATPFDETAATLVKLYNIPLSSASLRTAFINNSLPKSTYVKEIINSTEDLSKKITDYYEQNNLSEYRKKAAE